MVFIRFDKKDVIFINSGSPYSMQKDGENCIKRKSIFTIICNVLYFHP